MGNNSSDAKPVTDFNRRRFIAAGGGAVLFAATWSGTAANAAPSGMNVVPTVRQFSAAGSAAWTPTLRSRVVVDAASGLSVEAQLLATELSAALNGTNSLQIVNGRLEDARQGDVFLSVGAVAGSEGKEAYRLRSGVVAEILGASAAGVFYGTRTILQSVQATGAVAAGTVLDWPDRPERSFHLDMGRKFYSKAWIMARIKDLAWVKLNTLQLHFSENEGFRIECRSHPEIVSAERLSQQDVRDIVSFAAKYQITVIPSFDIPGHLRQVLNSYPQYRLRQANGTADSNNLDFSKPAARQLLFDIIDEFVPLFPAPYWHTGADEFIDLDNGEAKYPQLFAYAKLRYGPAANVTDAFVGFVNEVNARLRAKGKTVRAWNDGLYRKNKTNGVVKLDTNIQITHWTNWDRNMAKAQTFLDQGHQLINFNDSYFYYVLGENAGYQYPTAKKIYDNWSVGTFPSLPGGSPQQMKAPVSPVVRGASFSVWSDMPAAQTEQQVAQGIYLPLIAMSEKIWSAKPPAQSFSQFQSLVERIGKAI